jgi:hypothetical protein
VALPFQTSHLYLVLKGDYSFTSAEGWQVGIRLVPADGLVDPAAEGTLDGEDTDATSVARTESGWTISSEWKLVSGTDVFNPDDYLNDQVAPALLNYFGPGVANTCLMRSATLYPIKFNGKVNDSRKTVLDFVGTFPQGIDSSHQLPMEDAICVSWQTPQVGRRGRGRIYSPPAGTSAIDTHGFITSTVCDDLRDGWVSLLEGLSYTPVSLPGYHIRPIVTGSPWDRYGLITSVSVGNVVDRHGSRRRSIPETYNTPAVPSYP